jgi:hypothetical protein
MELKNRAFKDLYNMLEDAVYKFYELHVKCQVTEQKNQTLEQTFA